MPRRKDPLVAHTELLTEQLRALQPAAIAASNSESLHSLHGKIGGKNNVYVDSVRQAFLSPEQFIAEWMAGAMRKAQERDELELLKYGTAYQNAAVHEVIRFLKIPTVREYMELFLERTYFREHHARRREKPSEDLWEVWFGPKDQEFGLLITPRLTSVGEWENDVSEIRRAEFDYWTVGHVLETGLVVPGKKRLFPVNDVDSLLSLVDDVIVRATGSKYGKQLAARYVDFVLEQDDPEHVPFLIPEFRYDGRATKHRYRLDFAILSAEHNVRVGVELSPWSTHGRVRGKRALLKSGGEAAVERTRAEKFQREMKKRNEYFKRFGITTLTFTDEDLKDMDAVFADVSEYLLPSIDSPAASLPDIRAALDAYDLD